MDGKLAYYPKDKSYGIIVVEDDGCWKDFPFFYGRKNGVNFVYNIIARNMLVYAVEPHPLDC